MKYVLHKSRSFYKRKKLLINHLLRCSILVLCISGLIGMVPVIYTIEKNQKLLEEMYSVYTYENNAKVDYQVFLLPNKIYSQKSLKGGVVYIPSLIDYVGTEFNYSFKGQEKAEIKGKYKVTAFLESVIPGDSGDKRLWNKTFILQKEKTFSGKDRVVLLKNRIPVNMKEFKRFLDYAADLLKINFSSKLTIVWDISIEAKTAYGTVYEKLSPTMDISIGGLYAEIGGNLVAEKKGSIDAKRTIDAPDYKKKIIIGCVLEGLFIMGLLFVILFTGSLPRETRLVKKIKQIFKYHGDRLVVMNSDIDLLSRELMEVMTIEDLVRISDDLGKPILYKYSNKLEEITFFYVISNNTIFAVDIKKEMEKIPQADDAKDLPANI